MKVFTVVESEESFSDPLSTRVVGSYQFSPMAVSALIGHVVKRSQEDATFSNALWNDENRGDELREHLCRNVPLFPEDIKSYFCRDDEKKTFPQEVIWALRKFIFNNVEGENSYHVFSGLGASEHTIHLDIIKNELNGVSDYEV